ncbi:LysE family translocator [Arenibaculum pallidiluteum]|uniref:LysE family translocator n=1 Tax=Arenibaculum pallidiluteum TaxID=2812559 RepID=UPI001A97C9F3|nr:LysE family translocator [Arenibaculum pallidiluteum]
MEVWLSLAGVLATLAIGAASPGPSFVMVARTSVAHSRRHGIAAALGMGTGGVVFATLAVLGLTALLARVEWLYLGVRLLGGAYLLYLGWRIWQGAGEPLRMAGGGDGPPVPVLQSFWLSLGTQLSNPKTAIFYASIFAALLPVGAPPWAWAVLLPMVFAIEAGWYTLVAVAFSAAGPQAVYLRAKTWLDRAAAAVLGLLGLRLVTEAFR